MCRLQTNINKSEYVFKCLGDCPPISSHLKYSSFFSSATKLYYTGKTKHSKQTKTFETRAKFSFNYKKTHLKVATNHTFLEFSANRKVKKKFFFLISMPENVNGIYYYLQIISYS